jgi:FKBP-type peptidyl-prolyl cis-trans isomerase FkpA
MKNNNYWVSILAAIVIASCNNVDYKKTKSGLLYKIISSGNQNNPVAKENQYLKFNVVTKLNDSVMYSSYGKMPAYSKVPPASQTDYSSTEIFSMLRKGDSAVTISMIDTFLKKGMASQLPPTVKKGDRLITTFKILDVFTSDSLIQKDYSAEMAKDAPRKQKEMKEQMDKERKLMKEQAEKEEEELRKSGEVDKEINAMKSYLAAKKIPARQTGKGTFVYIKSQGNGPSANQGDTVTVKFAGRVLATDSVFESNSYSFPIGEGEVIQGWDEGIKLLKKGGKGTLFIPGFLAYGRNPRPPFRAFEALIFDVEVTDIRPVSGR